MKRYWIAIVAGGILTGLLVAKESPELNHRQKSLGGIEAVYVLVEELSAEARQAGLSEKQLQTEVAKRLEQEGIKVVTSQEKWLTIPGRPYLYIKNTTQKLSNTPIYISTTYIKFDQEVLLARDPNITTRAVTWETERQGIVGDKVFAESTLRVAGELVQQFIDIVLALLKPREFVCR